MLILKRRHPMATLHLLFNELINRFLMYLTTKVIYFSSPSCILICCQTGYSHVIFRNRE